ncbi:MAG: hypothetical protein IPQ19_14190 [Bacteroidetes bacterium]|nr:hypothetical protein [Bacteroidota bacterium]
MYKGPYLLEVEYRNLINGMKHFTDTAKIAKNQTQKIKQTLLNGDEIDKDLLGLRLRQLEQKTLDIKGIIQI